VKPKQVGVHGKKILEDVTALQIVEVPVQCMLWSWINGLQAIREARGYVFFQKGKRAMASALIDACSILFCYLVSVIIERLEDIRELENIF
jgi:hypothetical protein